jgi:hypothetical protein
MRRAGFALGLVFLTAAHVEAAEPGTPNAPGKGQSTAAAKPASSAAAPTPTAPSVAPAATPTAPAPKAGDTPPPEFYVEPAPSAGPQDAPPPAPSSVPQPPGPPPPPPSAGTDGRIFEPPSPDFYPENEGVFEPPPPPEAHHIAPRTSLWLGVRAGVFIPFGSLWARCSDCNTVPNNQYATLKGVPWRDYASAGPMFELDAGARLSRNYTVFALWERAQLGSGSGDPNSSVPGKASHGDTDFWGVGVRATSDPDRIGFVTELAIGYRRARSKWDDGTELQLTDAPFEARLGLGADIRLNRFVTLSPMLSLGVGSFGKVESVSNHTVTDQTSSLDQSDGHAWATLNLGGYFDLLASRR